MEIVAQEFVSVNLFVFLEWIKDRVKKLMSDTD